MVKFTFRSLRTITLVAAIFAFGPARSVALEGPSAKDIDIIGYASYEFGQVVKGQWNGGPVDHYWSHNVYAGVGFDAAIDEKLHIISRVEGKMWNPYPAEDRRDWRQRGYALWLDQACGTYTFDAGEGSQFSVTAGYYVYKYNREARNLGEFMFRSYTYPGILMNSFDFPAARILGFMFSMNLFGGNFKNDLMAFEESEVWPYGDISFANIGSCSFFNKILEIGGGIDLARLISVNNSFTTPQKPERCNYQIMGIDSTGAILYDSSQFYTFKGTKLMGRITLDLKPIFGSPNFFSPNDLKLYGEVGVIGWKNYPFWYENRSKRIPVVFGVNVPTMKLFDVCAVEGEYYPFPFNTSYMKTITTAIPQPNNEATSYNPDIYASTYWRWSVYLKRQIIPGFALTLQLARDHSRLNYTDGQPTWEETLVNHGSMAWVVKFSGYL